MIVGGQLVLNKQHIASLVCITFSYHVCFPFDAHIHYLTKETVQPSSHFQFVQHEVVVHDACDVGKIRS